MSGINGPATNSPPLTYPPRNRLAYLRAFPVLYTAVKAVPGTLQNGGSPFATTHWSVIAACARGSETADKALALLCRDYWPPLYSFVRRRGHSPADAQDLVQGFFAFLLETRAYLRTDRNKGKFRTFLLASLKHYMADAWDRERALKRGGDQSFVSLDEQIEVVEKMYVNEAAATTLSEEQAYEQRWATALVAHALARIGEEFANGQRIQLFNGLKPFLTGGVGLPSQTELAAKLDMPIETLRSHLSRLRARYRELLREEVARTIAVADDVDEELRHLCTILTVAC
jgi:RNA polymerase sigma factor (sigma-70 family)